MKLKTFQPFQVRITDEVSLIAEAKKGYYLFASRETCVSRDEPFNTWFVNYGCRSYIDLPNGQIYDYYVDNLSYFTILQKLANHLVENWEKHWGTYPLRKKKLIQTAKKLAKIVKTQDHKKILRGYLEVMGQLYDFCEYVWGAWAVIHILEKEVLEQFKDKNEILMSLEEPIEYLRMQKELFTLTPKEMVKKYGWLKIYSSYDTSYTENDFVRMKKELNQKEIEKQFLQFKINKNKFATFITTIHDQELKTKVKAVHTYAFLKTDRIDTWKKVQFYLRSFHQFIADKVKGCSLRNAANLTIQETIDFLEIGKIPNLQHLQLRSETKALYYWHDQVVEIVTAPEVIAETKKILEGELLVVTELKGFTACPGQARGLVKIINHSEDLKKIAEGDIFVAKYTFPTYTPFMLKAAAIVTDEGGITSHAAIISREYKKPCVIGVKKATSTFKDGDLVEVDADKGIVRIIKSGNQK